MDLKEYAGYALSGFAPITAIGSFGRQQRKKRKKYKRKMLKLAEQERDVGRLYGEKALGEVQKGYEAELGGYDKALKRSSSQLRTAKRQGIDQATKAAGDIATRYGGGFGQTTAYDDAVAGLSSQTTRNLADIDAAFAGMIGNLEIARGGAEAQGRGRYTQELQRRMGTETNYLDRLRSLYQDPAAYSPGLSGMEQLALGADVTGAAIAAMAGGGYGLAGYQGAKQAFSGGKKEMPFYEGAGGLPHYRSEYLGDTGGSPYYRSAYSRGSTLNNPIYGDYEEY